MKMSLTTPYGTFTADVPKCDDADLFVVCEELIAPVLKAAGWSQEVVKEAFSDEVDL